MKNYILVHGAWHGSWCWQKVVPLLQEAGHRVYTPDLPGSGLDMTPLSEVTLESYSDRVGHILDRLDSPAILIGHSLGGLTVSQVAEYYPEKIRQLVYLAASLPLDGESFLEMMTQLASDLSSPALIIDPKEQTCSIDPGFASSLFYHDCSDELVTWATAQLRPQAMSIYGYPLHLSSSHYGQLTKMYITCTQDRVIPPSLQHRMYTRIPCQVVSLETGHFPCFSNPTALAQLLLQL